MTPFVKRFLKTHIIHVRLLFSNIFNESGFSSTDITMNTNEFNHCLYLTKDKFVKWMVLKNIRFLKQLTSKHIPL